MAPQKNDGGRQRRRRVFSTVLVQEVFSISRSRSRRRSSRPYTVPLTYRAQKKKKEDEEKEDSA